MKRTLTALMLAAVFCLGVTGCSIRTAENAPDSASGATGGQSAGNDAAKDSYSDGTGQVGDLNQDEIGNGDAITNDNSNTHLGAANL